MLIVFVIRASTKNDGEKERLDAHDFYAKRCKNDSFYRQSDIRGVQKIVSAKKRVLGT